MGDNASFITNPDHFAVCSMAQLPVTAKQILTFDNMARAIRLQIADIAKEKDHATLLHKALFAAQMVKASCDCFISTTAAIVDTPAMAFVAESYGTASDVAGAVSKAATIGGAKADFIKIAFNAGADHVAGKLGGTNLMKEGAKEMGNLSKAVGGTLVDAANQDEDGIIGGMISSAAALGKLAAVGLKKKVASRIFGVGEALAKTTRAFIGAYKSYKEDNDDAMFDGLKRSLIQQLQMVEKHVDDLHRAIFAYENERASRMTPLRAAPALSLR